MEICLPVPLHCIDRVYRTLTLNVIPIPTITV